MAKTAAEILVKTLRDWGVEVIFGLPGDGINGIMESLRVCKDQIKLIQVRHEESAAFMACGYAKYTGKLGVCLATSGPGCGGIHHRVMGPEHVRNVAHLARRTALSRRSVAHINFPVDTQRESISPAFARNAMCRAMPVLLLEQWRDYSLELLRFCGVGKDVIDEYENSDHQKCCCRRSCRPGRNRLGASRWPPAENWRLKR